VRFSVRDAAGATASTLGSQGCNPGIPV
jgi:hypothetical protein